MPFVLLRRSGDAPETNLSQLLDFRKILEEVRDSGAPSSSGVELLSGPWPWPVFTLTKNPGVTAKMERVRSCGHEIIYSRFRCHGLLFVVRDAGCVTPLVPKVPSPDRD